MKKRILSGILGLGLAACTSYLWDYSQKKESDAAPLTQSNPVLAHGSWRWPHPISFSNPTEIQYQKDVARHRQEYSTLIDNINAALATREADIQWLAEELYQDHGCADEEKKTLTTEESKRIIAEKAKYIEGELLYSKPGVDDEGKMRYGILLPSINEHLTKIREEVADKDKLSGRSFIYSLALIRSYERCLHEQGVGDLYQDAFREKYAGNCEEARNLFSNLNDAREIVHSYRDYTCTPSEKGNLPQKEDMVQQYYDFLEIASDQELTVSAEFVPWDEFNRWNDLCVSHRREKGLSQAYAFCIADFTIANTGGEGGFNFPEEAKMTSDKLEEILESIPTSDQVRHCALERAFEEAFYNERVRTGSEGSFWKGVWTRYRRCMSKSS